MKIFDHMEETLDLMDKALDIQLRLCTPEEKKQNFINRILKRICK